MQGGPVGQVAGDAAFEAAHRPCILTTTITVVDKQLSMQPAKNGQQPDRANRREEEIADEEHKIELEEYDSLLENIDSLVADSLNDFPDDDNSELAVQAASIARASITEGTRTGHMRIIKAYVLFHLKANRDWDPKAITKDTPFHIRNFIMHKCGARESGFEGRRYSTAVSIRSGLTLWYRSIRPNSSSTVEWRYDESTSLWQGLPTHSREVSQFMIGLEKAKAKAGEVSQSVRALSLKDMHRLYELCLVAPKTLSEQRWGVVRYTAYVLAFLMLLRIDEVTKLEFEGLIFVPGEEEHYEVHLETCKAQQTGVFHDWRLHTNNEDDKLCPFRALICLSMLYGEDVTLSGPLFLRIGAQGSVLQEQPVKLGYRSWALYGTHSFRHGGCQYRVKDKGWSVDMVAAWGGWSQVEALTMFRYFYSPNDNHEYMAEYD
ncbi:hypothetical protein EWM64_g2501 [Hericium alpestre]|uniref:Tyr recombinase domain-containing protein n=1 Tax=Hericium alpestre TaxID=135208 RepID=A0A4Z0A5B2_9AGAM|nr:hypothetical protein EWM64_g2501 [Hericium alpestre]